MFNATWKEDVVRKKFVALKFKLKGSMEYVLEGWLDG